MWLLILVVILVLIIVMAVEHLYRTQGRGFANYAALTNWERVLLSHQTIKLFASGEYALIEEVDTLSDALEFEALMYLQGDWNDKQDYLAQAEHLYKFGYY